MGRKTRTRTDKRNLSNSEKRIEQLYIEAIRKAREGNLLPRKETTEIVQTVNEFGNNTARKSKRPEKILEEAIKKHQEQHRPQRRTLSVPVSRLVPFKNETTHGFQFPRDFKKDDLSKTWVPRASTASSCGITEYDRSLWGEFSNEDCAASESCSRPSTSTDSRNEKVEQTLHILPLRSQEDMVSLTQDAGKTKSNLPPIYRTSAWREKVNLFHGNRGSIPCRGEGWKDRGSVPLLIGKEELHKRRLARKDTLSLAERRIALKRSKK